MINKRLINLVENSKRMILANVIFQWIMLLNNIVFITCLAITIKALAKGIISSLCVSRYYDNEYCRSCNHDQIICKNGIFIF